jgi:hypothetical protein
MTGCIVKTGNRGRRWIDDPFTCEALDHIGITMTELECGVPNFVTQSMIHTGTVHILVVSGFNVGIVAFLVILLSSSFIIELFMRLVLG